MLGWRDELSSKFNSGKGVRQEWHCFKPEIGIFRDAVIPCIPLAKRGQAEIWCVITTNAPHSANPVVLILRKLLKASP